MEFINRDGIFYVTFERFNNIIYFEKDKNTFCKNIYIRIFFHFMHLWCINVI